MKPNELETEHITFAKVCQGLPLVKRVLWLDYLKPLHKGLLELPGELEEISSKGFSKEVSDFMPSSLREMMLQHPELVSSNVALSFLSSVVSEQADEQKIKLTAFLQAVEALLSEIRRTQKAGSQYFLQSIVERGAVSARHIGEPIVLSTATIKPASIVKASSTNKLEYPEVAINDCWFEEEVCLTNLSEGPALTFSGCVFEKGLRASEAEIGRSLTLINCVLKAPYMNNSLFALNMENAHIKGDLLLRECSLQGMFYAPGLRVENYVRFLSGCRIAFRLSYISDPITVSQIMNPRWSDVQEQLAQRSHLTTAINLNGVKIGGNLRISSDNTYASTIYGSINCNNSIVGGDIELYELLCPSDIGFQSTHVNGNVTWASCRISASSLSFAGITVDGIVSLYRMKIGGDLSFMNATIKAAVGLAEIETDGKMSLYRTTIGGNLGLKGVAIGGDLTLAFSTIRAYMTAFHEIDSKSLQQKCLSVGGDLILSAAEVKVVELRGAEIKGSITIRSGIFGGLSLTLGIELKEGEKFDPSNREKVRFVVKPCRAEAVEMSAITVRENLDLSGLKVVLPDDEVKQTKLMMEQNGSGIVITKSTIGRDLIFFIDDIRRPLERRYNTLEKTVNWDVTPTPSDCASETWGKLTLNANKIGGHLDLRNMAIAGELDLSDTSVGLDINMDAGDPDFERFKTECHDVSAEKLECNGDLKLSGLRVERNFLAPGANVRGEILFLPRDKKERKECVIRHDAKIGNAERATRPGAPPKYALIKGRLDLTSVRANHILISGENLNQEPPEKEVSLSGSSRMRRLGNKLVEVFTDRQKRIISFKNRLFPKHNTDEAQMEARILLERGDIGRLEIVKPPLLGPANLTAVTVSQWVFGNPRAKEEEDEEADADNYIKALAKMMPFDRSTWINVENSLRNEAQDSEANKVYIEMRSQVRRNVWESYSKPSPKWQAAKKLLWLLWDYAQYFAIRYGTRVWRPMIIALLLFIPTFLTFWNQDNVRATSGLLQVLGPTDENTTRRPLKQRSSSPESLALELSPRDLGIDWTWRDALALTLRYQVPIIPGMTHQWWEAGGRPLCIKGFNICVTVEQYAFGVELYHWLAWSLFLIGAAAQVFRGKRS